MLLDLGRRARDLDRLRSGHLDALARQILGGGKSPGAVGQHANADAQRLAVGHVPDLAVLGGEPALALVHDAAVGELRAVPAAYIQRPTGNFLHAHNRQT